MQARWAIVVSRSMSIPIRCGDNECPCQWFHWKNAGFKLIERTYLRPIHGHEHVERRILQSHAVSSSAGLSSLSSSTTNYVTASSICHVQVRRDIKRDHHCHTQREFHFIWQSSVFMSLVSTAPLRFCCQCKFLFHIQ